MKWGEGERVRERRVDMVGPWGRPPEWALALSVKASLAGMDMMGSWAERRGGTRVQCQRWCSAAQLWSLLSGLRFCLCLLGVCRGDIPNLSIIDYYLHIISPDPQIDGLVV